MPNKDRQPQYQPDDFGYPYADLDGQKPKGSIQASENTSNPDQSRPQPVNRARLQNRRDFLPYLALGGVAVASAAIGGVFLWRRSLNPSRTLDILPPQLPAQPASPEAVKPEEKPAVKELDPQEARRIAGYIVAGLVNPGIAVQQQDSLYLWENKKPSPHGTVKNQRTQPFADFN